MKFTIHAVGHLKTSPERELVNRYCQRLKNSLTIVEIPISSDILVETRKTQETRALLASVPARNALFILDEHGQPWTSRQLADRIQVLASQGTQGFSFLIGGPDGLDTPMLTASQTINIAFGSMTWPHALVRAMLAEQIYRCAQICRHHPYHRE